MEEIVWGGKLMHGNDLLIGQDVCLTVLTKDELPQMVEWQADVEYLRMFTATNVFPPTIEDMEDWYKAQTAKNDRYIFAIRLQGNDQFIGICMAKSVEFRSGDCKVSIRIGDPTMRGKGYGTDATRTLLKFIFLELGLHRVQLRVISYNTAAIRSYEKVGFQHEGKLRDAIRRDGRYYDLVQMGILRHEWEKL
jgi:RimJ/RimL family protein N-acetyltransferase